MQGDLERGALFGGEAALEPRGHERTEQRGPSGVADIAGERVDADPASWLEEDRNHAHRLCERAVLALRIDDDASSARDSCAGEQSLDKCALAPADLARDEHVGVGDEPLGIGIEGIEPEHAAERARPHDDAARRGAAVAAPGHDRRHVPSREQLGGRPDGDAPPHGAHHPGTEASSPRRWSPSQRRSCMPQDVASARSLAAATSSSSGSAASTPITATMRTEPCPAASSAARSASRVASRVDSLDARKPPRWVMAPSAAAAVRTRAVRACARCGSSMRTETHTQRRSRVGACGVRRGGVAVR